MKNILICIELWKKILIIVDEMFSNLIKLIKLRKWNIFVNIYLLLGDSVKESDKWKKEKSLFKKWRCCFVLCLDSYVKKLMKYII